MTSVARPTVLIVEDDPDLRGLLEEILMDYDVIGASDGRDALERCAEQRPDVILLDLMMPAMDGREFWLRYRELPDCGARVIVMSAARDVERLAAEIGAVAVLRKPFEIAEVERLVSEHALS
ncbi:MAG: response regulator [Candidatus Limnocylindria bacterium]